MRIGIEGQRLFREKKHGMDMVALELILNLQKIDTENEYFIYVKPDVDECLHDTANFKIRKVEGGAYPFWEQKSLPAAAAADKVDVLHCTSNTAPLKTAMPLMITLHDIIYMEHSMMKIIGSSGTAYQRFGNVYRRYVVPRVMKKSDIIITVSNFEKKRIEDFFGIKDNRLRAVYNGVSEHFKEVTDSKELKRVKELYNLPDKYFFFLGNTDPKKNTPGVLKAYSDYRKQSGLDIQLVMLDFDREELLKMAKSVGDEDIINHIHLTGYVKNTDLPAIYSQCEIFLYPSLRESFGIPVLEAMGCAVPVITSNTSSMPEVSGGAAILVDPYKPEEITDAIHRFMTDNALRDEYRQKGPGRAREFSWKAMSEHVLELYKEVVNKHIS